MEQLLPIVQCVGRERYDMAPKRKVRDFASGDDAALSLSTESACYLIFKLREFEAKDVLTDAATSSNASDDNMVAVLESHRSDPVVQEVTAMVDSLTVDQQADLVALLWLGRDGSDASDWADHREEAGRADAGRISTAAYLLGTPLASEYLEAGLNLLGRSCADVEAEHL